MNADHDRLAAVMLSISVHLAAFLAIVWVAPHPRVPMTEAPGVVMALIDLPPPPPPAPPAPVPAPTPPAAVEPDPAPPAPDLKAPQPKAAKRSPRPTPRPPPPDVPALAAGPADKGPAMLGLSAGELAGATPAGGGAGGGGGGGSCDMAGRLQTALRKSPRIQAAIASAHRAAEGQAFKVWNGDWVRSQGQDGEGLAIVREAMLLEIGFAPAACRNQTVRGLVLFSLSDGPEAARFAVGAGVWRWADLLRARGAVRSTAFR